MGLNVKKPKIGRVRYILLRMESVKNFFFKKKINPDKTELIIFTRKHMVPPFAPPSLAKIRLEAMNSVKYLGVTLEMKLKDF